ncbi:uncharacterized protein LOC126319850 [Schistocerca gregaria]|uniref:uncharacterized protein LOC126319850 n=1 Tax=Schistocerca gregaria TaxID=7010 RepID=UPI00211EA8B4|nr:uncharacterized protein LOC126319850 [Schistocerca gregaria]XP_049849493.1 uncharacterized protein LOC126319850 [Schistocerca gregaria]
MQPNASFHFVQLVYFDAYHAFLLFFHGFLDSLRFDIVMKALREKEVIRNASINCLGLNLLTYTGSLAAYYCFFLRFVTWITTRCASSPKELQVVIFLNKFYFIVTDTIFCVFWLVLVYAFSFLVSSRWNAVIVDSLHSTGHAYTASSKRFIITISDEILYIARMIAFMTTNALIGFVPYIGPYASFVLNCWMTSFYSFEAAWRKKNYQKTSSTYLIWLEKDWAYFAGFGFILTLFTMRFSIMTSLSIFSAVFPAFIIMAANPEAFAWRKDKRYIYKIFPQSIKFFEVARNTTDYVTSGLLSLFII